MYLGTFSRRARSLATCFCFARVRIIGTLVPFCVIGTSKEFPITQKNRHTFLYNGFLYISSKLHTEFLLLLSFILLGNNFLLPIQFLTISFWLSPRPISNSQLHVLLRFHLCPIYLVVFKGSYYLRMGYLILRGASRLDAFSVYPVPAWLLCHEPDGSTDTPEASPPRSSRTKGSSSQISYARAG